MTVRAHFNGTVIVPDEPVDLPVNTALEVEIKRPPRKETRFRKKHGIPLARNDGVPMTAEEVAATLNDG